MAHGHDDHHGHHGNETNKSLIISAVVIVAFCGGMYGLVQEGTAARNAQVGEVPAEQQQGKATAPAAHQPTPVVRTARVASSGQVDRANFATTFHKGQRRQNFTLTAQATGPDKTVFEISWPAKADDGKIDALKKARPLHFAARARGFKKIVIRVGPKVVWETAL